MGGKEYVLVLNIAKTQSIVFGTNHLLNPKSQLNLVINNVEISILGQLTAWSNPGL
jgi:hypothetical protein